MKQITIDKWTNKQFKCAVEKPKQMNSSNNQFITYTVGMKNGIREAKQLCKTLFYLIIILINL